MNANLWNSDDTRFTVLLGPGRVKRGILPNLELGRAIQDRGRYSIVIDAAWRDAKGQPLKEAYRRDEDPSGNQVGRAFEMQPGTASDSRPRPEMVALPFMVGDTFAERR